MKGIRQTVAQRNSTGMLSDSSSGGGVSFAGLLTVLFIGLKLGHVITWSWVWVLSPIWITFLVALVAIAAILIWDALT